jgi:hypothetical protein
MITEAEIEREKAAITACTDRGALMLRIRQLVGKAESIVSATPMRRPVQFDADDVETFVFDLEALVEVLTVGAEHLRSLP